MFLAVALVHVLDDLFSAVGGKVDVDVGHGVCLLAQKALKEQVVAQRVYGGDVQQVGDQRVGGRPAPLAADATPAGELDDVPHDEKVAGQPGVPDDG